MAIRQSTLFEAYDFTDEEFEFAKTFTDSNLQFLKTLRTQAATEKLSIPFNPLAPGEFLQNEAVLRGKIDVLTLLIGD